MSKDRIQNPQTKMHLENVKHEVADELGIDLEQHHGGEYSACEDGCEDGYAARTQKTAQEQHAHHNQMKKR